MLAWEVEELGEVIAVGRLDGGGVSPQPDVGVQLAIVANDVRWLEVQREGVRANLPGVTREGVVVSRVNFCSDLLSFHVYGINPFARILDGDVLVEVSGSLGRVGSAMFGWGSIIQPGPLVGAAVMAGLRVLTRGDLLA